MKQTLLAQFFFDRMTVVLSNLVLEHNQTYIYTVDQPFSNLFLDMQLHLESS